MSSNRARAFAERRNTEEEVQTILKHNPNMARDTVAIVISALIATKTSTAFIQKAIRKFRAAVVVVQRVARKWYYWSRRCMLRLVEQWVIHDCEALKGNATVPTESLFSCFPIRGESIRKNKPEVSVTEPLGTDMPLFFSGQLRYRIVREVYIERRSVFRKRFKTWKHHLDSMECELQMVETKIRQLSNRERRKSEAVGDGHRILSPKLVSMISQSLNERHSILIASIEKERQMSPVFDFTVQFSELQQRAILYCRKDASQLIKSVIDRLGIVPQENKIPQQEIDHFGHISATNSIVKNKIKFQGNMEVNTRKKKKKFLEKKNNNLMREMEDRYLDLTGPIMAASLSAQAISPPRRNKYLTNTNEELLTRNQNSMCIQTPMSSIAGFDDAFFKDSSTHIANDLSHYYTASPTYSGITSSSHGHRCTNNDANCNDDAPDQVMRSSNAEVNDGVVMSACGNTSTLLEEGTSNNIFITGTDILGSYRVGSRAESPRQHDSYKSLEIKPDTMIHLDYDGKISRGRREAVTNKNGPGTNWGCSMTPKDFGTAVKREFRPIQVVPQTHKLVDAVDIIADMKMTASSRPSSIFSPSLPTTERARYKRPIGSSGFNQIDTGASSCQKRERGKHVDIQNEITHTGRSMIYPPQSPLKNIPKKRISAWELERLSGFYPYYKGSRAASIPKMEKDGETTQTLSKFGGGNKEALRLSQEKYRPRFVEWDSKKRNRIIIRKDRMKHWDSKTLDADIDVPSSHGKESQGNANQLTESSSYKSPRNALSPRKRALSSERLKKPIQTVVTEKSSTGAITCLEVVQVYSISMIKEYSAMERKRLSSDNSSSSNLRMKRSLFKASNTTTSSPRTKGLLKKENATSSNDITKIQTLKASDPHAAEEEDIVLIVTGSIDGTVKIIAHPSGAEVFYSLGSTAKRDSVTNLLVVRGSSSTISDSQSAALYEGDITTICYVSDDDKIRILKRAPETMPVIPYLYQSTSSQSHTNNNRQISPMGLPWDAEWWIHATITMPCTPTSACIFKDLLAVGGYDCKVRFIPIDYYPYLRREEVLSELEKQKKAELALMERQQKIRAQAAKARQNLKKFVGEKQTTQNTDENRNYQGFSILSPKYSRNSFNFKGSSNSLVRSSFPLCSNKEPGDSRVFSGHGYLSTNPSPLTDEIISPNFPSSSDETRGSRTGLHYPGALSFSSGTSTLFCSDSNTGNDRLLHHLSSFLIKDAYNFVNDKKAHYIAKSSDPLTVMVLDRHVLAITKVISWDDIVISASLDSHCFVFKINNFVTDNTIKAPDERTITAGIHLTRTSPVVEGLSNLQSSREAVRSFCTNIPVIQLDDSMVSTSSVTQSKADSSSCKASGGLDHGLIAQRFSDSSLFKSTEKVRVLELESVCKFTPHSRSILDLVRIGTSSALVCTASSDMTVCIWSALLLVKQYIFTFNCPIRCPIIVMPPNKINKSSDKKEDSSFTTLNLDINIVLCFQNASVVCCSVLTGAVVCDINPDVLSDVCICGTPLSSSCVALGTYSGRIIVLNTKFGAIVGSRVVHDGACNVLALSPYPNTPQHYSDGKDDSVKVVDSNNVNSLDELTITHGHRSMFEQLKPILFSGSDTRKHGAHIVDMTLLQSMF